MGRNLGQCEVECFVLIFLRMMSRLYFSSFHRSECSPVSHSLSLYLSLLVFPSLSVFPSFPLLLCQSFSLFLSCFSRSLFLSQSFNVGNTLFLTAIWENPNCFCVSNKTGANASGKNPLNTPCSATRIRETPSIFDRAETAPAQDSPATKHVTSPPIFLAAVMALSVTGVKAELSCSAMTRVELKRDRSEEEAEEEGVEERRRRPT